MKRNLLLSLLFFIATTLMAIHEVEHIKYDHTSCEICVLVNNFVSPDISVALEVTEVLHFGAIQNFTTNAYYYEPYQTYKSRAPPSLSSSKTK